MIEKRWSSRQPLQLEVNLECAGNQMHGRTVDIGLGGAFVEVDAYYLEQDSDVILRFDSSKNTQVAATDLNARVVRVADQGVGLMFQNFDADAYRSLKTVMSYA